MLLDWGEVVIWSQGGRNKWQKVGKEIKDIFFTCTSCMDISVFTVLKSTRTMSEKVKGNITSKTFLPFHMCSHHPSITTLPATQASMAAVMGAGEHSRSHHATAGQTADNNYKLNILKF